MKIMQVIPELGIGGAEIMCENLATALSVAGHKVLVVSLFNTHTVITDKLEQNKIQIVYVGKKKGIDLSLPIKIHNIINNFQPDVIHTHLNSLIYVFLAQICNNVKIIHTIHHLADKESKKNRLLNKILFRYFNITPIALSKQIQNSIIREYKLSPFQVPIVFNGVPIHNCIKKTSYDFDKYINLIHMGRFHPAKNHMEMIKAIVNLHTEYPQVMLHLFGEGELKNQITECVTLSKAQNFVIIHGPTIEPLKELSKADIFIFPSIYEGFPMSIIEAMGTGLPIVASNVGGIPDMISNNYDGLLCLPTSDSIYKNVKRLILSSKLRKYLGENALDSAQKFSSFNMAKEYEKVYCEKVRINK